MPIIYLSPSTQEKNYYVNGGTEEQYMNLLADKMVPYLNASGIRYSRNTPEMTAVSSIAASNAGNYDLHLALHSNAAPEGKYGSARGYHDNQEDAAWIKQNLDAVAKNLVMSLCDFFDIPFLDPSTSRLGRVDVDWGVLNIRARPDLEAPILAQAPDGSPLTLLNQSGGWYLVNYAGTIGYAKDDFVTLN